MNTRFLPILALTALLLATAFGCRPNDTSPSGGGAKFHCPMHPAYVSDRMGDCPICNMKLVPIPATTSGSTNAAHSGGDGDVPGRITISIPPDKQQLIGLRTAVVEARELSHVIRTTATFEHDETRYARIAPRYGGWVRTLHAGFTGQRVEKGQPLFTVYSPELLAAEGEYLNAWRRSQEPDARAEDPRQSPVHSLLDSARRRLGLLELGEDDLHELEKLGTAREEVVVRAPVSGHILAKRAIEGRSFMPGETLFEIANLDPLWLRASVFEYELSLVRTGLVARISLPYFGNRTLESSVTFIYPHIDPQTRRASVRLEVPNPRHDLRPDMWAQVEIQASYGRLPAVPASAVIDTGTRWIAFVQRDDGHLEPREVTVGIRTDDYYEVRDGLKEGEKVVTRALFLVDSESQLKAAIAAMSSSAPHAH